MNADKRNTVVVIALILSMTIGARVLLSFESWLGAKPPHWEAETLLMAQRGMPAQEVVISYVASLPDFDTRFGAASSSGDSVCVIYPAAEPDWLPAGPRVQMIVVGSESDTLTDVQKRHILGAVGSLSQDRGAELVRVRLAGDSDPRLAPDLPPQTADLRDLLVRKRIID